MQKPCIFLSPYFTVGRFTVGCDRNMPTYVSDIITWCGVLLWLLNIVYSVRNSVQIKLFWIQLQVRILNFKENMGNNWQRQTLSLAYSLSLWNAQSNDSLSISIQNSNTKGIQNLHDFFWVIPRRLNFICRRFGTLCSIFIGR